MTLITEFQWWLTRDGGALLVVDVVSPPVVQPVPVLQGPGCRV